jgi:hypothetical protein
MSRVNTFTLPKDPTYITGPNARIVLSSAVVGVTSSSTSNVKLYSILIPANTFSLNEVLDVRTLVSKSATNGTCTLRFYINSTDAVGGVLFGTATYISSSRQLPFHRRLALRSVTNSTIAFRTTVSASTDIIFTVTDDNGHSTGGVESLVIDWTADRYLVVGGQLSSNLDVMQGIFLKINN